MEDEEPEDILCTKCGVSTYQGETIFCETCELWFHWTCTGVKAGDAVVKDESLPYYCPDCVGGSAGRSKGRKKAGSSSKNAAAKSKAKTTGKSKQVPVAVAKPSFKLKLKLTGKSEDLLGNSPSIEPIPSPAAVKEKMTKQRSTSSTSAVKKKEGRAMSEKVLPKAPDSYDLESLDVEGEDERDEEERWLDAVEAGDASALADRDPELRTLMDPKLMTSRQRAMVEKGKRGKNGDDAEPVDVTDDGHISLDFFNKPKKKKTEESEHDLRVKALKIQQRKEVETQKREENKLRTMERLLNKKESKAAKASRAATVQQKPEESRKWTYVNNSEGARLHLPPEEQYPLSRQEYRLPPTPVLCVVSGCGQLKRYSCSKTGQPLSSMGRSRSRSPRSRRRSRSRSRSPRSRDKRRRSSSREDRTRRRREHDRDRSRSRDRRRREEPVPSSSSAAAVSSVIDVDRTDKDWDREREKRKKDKVPVGMAHSHSAAPSNPGLADVGLQGKTDEEIEMMKLMGFATFDTTKNKKVPGNNTGDVHVVLKRKYRQYMNRRGGFNRPLDYVH